MKRVLTLCSLGLALALVIYLAWLGVPRHDWFVERAGRLDSAERVAFAHGAETKETFRLVSTTGLVADLRVLRPAAPGQRLPVLLLIGGQRTGKDAVDLAGVQPGVALVAIDYPYAGNRDPEGFWSSLAIAPDVQRAFLDTPPALSLTVGWLLEQPWVDPNRVEIIGASLGVPFAAVAGAIDPRVSRVWLLHGGADNVSWVSHAGRKHIGNDTLRRLVARMALLLVHGPSFDTPEWIRETAPRPVVVVAARDDDYVPAEAQAPFVELAKLPHVELLWTEGLHIGPGRNNELQQLLDVVLTRVAAGGPIMDP